MIRYFTETGQTLERDDWFRRFSSPEWKPVRRTIVRGVVVETSFLGLSSSREAEPRPYLVSATREAEKETKDGTVKVVEVLAERWEANIELALAAHGVMERRAEKGWKEAKRV